MDSLNSLDLLLFLRFSCILEIFSALATTAAAALAAAVSPIAGAAAASPGAASLYLAYSANKSLIVC